ncbi:MAG: hypothetical protein L3K52_08260 [Candidatus Thiothrix sulfatifontis]|nr:MAG: hypothetical protein L3K52_08260 [Candidatus Thiothrix sulfatifontis]
MRTLFSLIESPMHPNFSVLYQQLGIAEQRFTAARKLHKALQQQPPDFLVGEFIYGFGNNYAGANVCNLDVTLRALQRFSPHTNVIVLVPPNEAPYVEKLLELFPIHAVLTYPVNPQAMQDALQILL